MALTANELRDVVKLLESGKPLPDQYRFKLFDDKREVELVWNGKTNEVCNIVLPFQVIEQVDEPRDEVKNTPQAELFDFRGRQQRDWTNKLIWGDNKLILSSLKNGPLREEIEANGGIKLIYIDPPFDVGADFSMDIEVGDEQFHKQSTVLEELAYRDTWGKGADSFISMIYERLALMCDLLAKDGSIYVHCDWRVSPYIRLVLNELLGDENFRNEIIWHYSGWRRSDNYQFSRKHDSIFFYTKSHESWNYKVVSESWIPEYSLDFLKQQVILSDGEGDYLVINESKIYLKTLLGTYIANRKQAIHRDELGEYVWADGRNTVKRYLKDVLIIGKAIDDVWNIAALTTSAKERLGYDTQKPETLVETIVRASSNDNDIIADFFCGSGTTLAVAEKLNRKWIGSDLGKFALHTTRKRLIGIQRDLKNAGNDYRAFEILNLGRYAREHYVGINPNLSDDQKQQQIAQREKDFIDLIVRAYRAEHCDGFNTFQAKKNGRLVSIGPINLPVTRLFVEEVLKECIAKQITRVDILAFEFEMGLFPKIQEEAKLRGVDLALKYVPKDVFDKRAVEKNQVVFNDVSYIEVKPKVKGKTITIELTGFAVFYNQDTVDNVAESMRGSGTKLVVQNGQIIKVTKDPSGIIETEVVTKKWTDWIDYWSVDFEFESKKEIIRSIRVGVPPTQPNLDGTEPPQQLSFGDYEERWTGDYIFENEWQSFRTKKSRTLDLVSSIHEYPSKGRHKVAVKVVDIFGNDTMKIVDINI